MLRFDVVRAQGFPVYSLNRTEKLEELRSLLRFDHRSLIQHGEVGQTMHALGLVNSYHPHMWSVTCGDMLTASDVYRSDTLLKDALERRKRLGKCETLSDFRKALKTYSGTQSVSNFRPSAASAIYDRYLPDSGGTVYDPSAGFGGRLLGSLACPKVKRYVGCEPARLTFDGLTAMHDELTTLMEWLGFQSPLIELHPCGSEDFRPNPESVDLVFTSPPYGGWEKYSNEQTQSWVRYPSNDEWLNVFMRRTLKNCRVGLKLGGYLVINLAATRSFPNLTEDFVNMAKGCGFEHVDTLHLLLSAIPGTRKQGDAFKREPIFVFRRTR